jgi:hypothetical protein
MGKLIAWVACLLFGHEAPRDGFGHFSGNCSRCHEDARPSWLVELEWMDRLEAMALREIQKKRKAS